MRTYACCCVACYDICISRLILARSFISLTCILLISGHLHDIPAVIRQQYNYAICRCSDKSLLGIIARNDVVLDLRAHS